MNEFIVLKGFRKMGTGWEGMMSEFMTFLSYVGILHWTFYTGDIFKHLSIASTRC